MHCWLQMLGAIMNAHVVDTRITACQALVAAPGGQGHGAPLAGVDLEEQGKRSVCKRSCERNRADMGLWAR